MECRDTSLRAARGVSLPATPFGVSNHMKSPTRPPVPSRHAIRTKAPTLVVSNSNARPFTYYLNEASSMLRNHGSVKLSGVGAATQHALVVSEVLAARGIGRVTEVRTSSLDKGETTEHEAKIEVTIGGA